MKQIKTVTVEGALKKGGVGVKKRKQFSSSSKAASNTSKRSTGNLSPPKKKRRKSNAEGTQPDDVSKPVHKGPDDVDLAILSSKQRDRTDWNQEEDSMVMTFEL